MSTLFLKQIKQESTREKAHAAIKEAIITGRLQTGERITETNLAESLNVSRAIVREALQRLAHEGLVEQNSYKGTRVVRLTPEQVEEIVAVRVLLEAEAVRLAKARLTETDKKTLRSAATKLESSTRYPRTYVELDLALHEKIWAISGNETLRRLLVQATGPLFAMGAIVRSAKMETRGRTKSEYRASDHMALVESVCDGTPEQAVRAMSEHITLNSKFTRENFERFYASQQASVTAPKPRARRKTA